MERISERDLILPSLWCIEKNNESLTTTDLIQCLRELLNPTGEDLSILESRNDDKFSQKVRNLVSHKTLEKVGLIKYEKVSNIGYLSLTKDGSDFLHQNLHLIEYLFAGEFSYDDTKEAFAKVETPSKENFQSNKKIIVFDESLVIKEGNQLIFETKVYSRSKKLRDLAVEHYSTEGRIMCLACSFDFESVYGELGKGFIEVHHTKPIIGYEEDDLEKQIKDALRNVIPLCANCHRMVHRRKGYVLSLPELSAIIKIHRHKDNDHQYS